MEPDSNRGGFKFRGQSSVQEFSNIGILILEVDTNALLALVFELLVFF